MRILHLADLHIGRKLAGYSLREDQEAILTQLLTLAREQADGIVLAGDLYNRAQPGSEAVELASDFLTRLARLQKPVFAVAGNHDGAEQISYCRELLAQTGLKILGAYGGTLERHIVRDEFGPVEFTLLPYLRPAQARRFFPGEKIETTQEAIRTVLREVRREKGVRKVLIAHQFVLGGSVSDSEEHIIGGLDAVSPDVFSAFDYVALGHLHRPQSLLGGRVRYAGSPLKYAMGESEQKKSATVAILDASGKITLETHALSPLRDVRRIQGTLGELTSAPRSEDFVEITLTGTERPIDPIGALAPVYPYLTEIRREDAPGERPAQEPSGGAREEKTPLEHFIDFYRMQNGHEPDERQITIVREILQKGGGES